ncbi:MAG: hypothetical protein ACLQGP_34120 [Isosphaeraceae bacterium]
MFLEAGLTVPPELADETEATDSGAEQDREPPPHFGFPTKGDTELLNETLALIPRATHTPNLVRFLLSRETKRANLNEICKHIYKSVDKGTLAKARLLIKRAMATLDYRNAPLRIVRDEKNREIKVIRA